MLFRSMVDNRVAMLRTVRTPSRNDVDALSRALLGEIRRTMAAAQNQLTGHRVERIVLCGAGPVAETFKKSVEAKLSCDVELFDPFSGLQVAGELVENKPAYSGRFAPLLGMLADEAASAAHGIDFLHPREKPTPPSPWRKNGVYAALGVSVCVAIGLVLLFNRMSMDTRIADLNQESRGMQETVENVAFEATVRQQWPDTGFKELQLLCCRFVGRQGGWHKNEADGQAG